MNTNFITLLEQLNLTLYSSLFYKLFVLMYIAGVISFIILNLNTLLQSKNTWKHSVEKSGPYECGFVPFDDPRFRFDVRFYLVAILFLIFDLEISFLFPWIFNLIYGANLYVSFWSMILFLIILTVGFIYEWQKGALEWQ